jgi:hypothetical protein
MRKRSVPGVEFIRQVRQLLERQVVGRFSRVHFLENFR